MAAEVGPFYDARVQTPAEVVSGRRPAVAVTAIAAVAAALLQAGVARADGPTPNVPVVQDDPLHDPEAGEPRPPAKDTRTGHVTLSGRFGVAAPGGYVAAVGPEQISQGVPINDVAAVGLNYGATLGVGVTRYGVLEATVDYARLGAPVGCSVCFGQQITFALGFSYHLAQGIALDPWVSYGVGFRFSTYHAQDELTSKIQDVSFRGIDVARLALGAEFYPLPVFGIGPFFEIDAGTNVSFPAGTVTFAGSSVEGGYSPAPYGLFMAGIRVTLDPLRWNAGRAKTTSVGRVSY